MKKEHREKGVIKAVRLQAYRGGPDDPPDTGWIHIDFGGAGQGFGGLYLKDQAGVDAWVKHFTEAFGVEKYEDLVGLECYALRSFADWGTNIHGLETMAGKRVTVNTYRLAAGLGATKSNLEQKIEDIQNNIKYHRRSIEESKEKLVTVGDNYVEWD